MPWLKPLTFSQSFFIVLKLNLPLHFQHLFDIKIIKNISTKNDSSIIFVLSMTKRNTAKILRNLPINLNFLFLLCHRILEKIETSVLGLFLGYSVLMLITLLKAEEPNNAEEAPFNYFNL